MVSDDISIFLLFACFFQAWSENHRSDWCEALLRRDRKEVRVESQAQETGVGVRRIFTTKDIAIGPMRTFLFSPCQVLRKGALGAEVEHVEEKVCGEVITCVHRLSPWRNRRDLRRVWESEARWFRPEWNSVDFGDQSCNILNRTRIVKGQLLCYITIRCSDIFSVLHVIYK